MSYNVLVRAGHKAIRADRPLLAAKLFGRAADKAPDERRAFLAEELAYELAA